MVRRRCVLKPRQCRSRNVQIWRYRNPDYKGTPDRSTIAQGEIAASGMTPLEFLGSAYRGPKQPMTRRIDAANLRPQASGRLQANRDTVCSTT